MAQNNRFQVSGDKEPQNTEQGILNAEGKENLSIRNSLFDIQFSKWCAQKLPSYGGP